MEAELRDLALLLGGLVEFGDGVVAQAGAEDGEHLGGGLAAGADEEDAAEFGFVLAVGGGELLLDVVGELCGGLLVCGHGERGGGGGFGLLLADARVRVERVLPRQ